MMPEVIMENWLNRLQVQEDVQMISKTTHFRLTYTGIFPWSSHYYDFFSASCCDDIRNFTEPDRHFFLLVATGLLRISTC
jgi:hypothetical protein